MYKVLIVDDEQLIRSGMIARFQYLNFTFERIREAASGVEALALLEKEPADIVITDGDPLAMFTTVRTVLINGEIVA